MMKKRNEKILNSAIWAAYGDAMGFISELSDEKTLKWRTGEQKISGLVRWKRKLGGRFGEIIDLPKGCISDDTQLRLATSRAIGPNGSFDVEAFAIVELPCWRLYGLGGGRGTKAAAKNLTKKGVNWAHNFFDEKQGPKYVDVGGNGAAMRIQPHIWASKNLDKTDIIKNVVMNSVVTHGHLRGILGALFHALALRFSMNSDQVAGPKEWRDFVKDFDLMSEVTSSVKELKSIWKPTWERLCKKNLEDEIKAVSEECLKDIDKLELILKKYSSAESYKDAVRSVGGFEQNQRGSGTKTALLASFLAKAEEHRPEMAIQISANTLDSDTDTIATMCGAIIGAVTSEKPKDRVHNQEYIESEANRIIQISEGVARRSYFYPDLFAFKHPSSSSDYFGTTEDGKTAILGMGYARVIEEIKSQKKNSNFYYSWVRLNSGQEIIISRRNDLKQVAKEGLPSEEPKSSNFHIKQQPSHDATSEKVIQRSLFESHEDSLEKEMWAVIKSDFNPALLGDKILRLLNEKDGLSKSVGFTAMVGAAYRARKGKK